MMLFLRKSVVLNSEVSAPKSHLSDGSNKVES